MKLNTNQYGLLTAMLFCIVGLFGCSSTAKTSEQTAPKTGEPTNAKPANSDKEVAANNDKIGVPECDDYLEKYEACIFGKVPEAARSAMKSSFEQTRKTWKDLAANPQTKASLASVCKQSKDAAKQAMAAYKCEW